MDTGQREAKLMEGDGGLKYWSQEGKQGRRLSLTELSLLKSKDSTRVLNITILNDIDSCVLQFNNCRNSRYMYIPTKYDSLCINSRNSKYPTCMFSKYRHDPMF